jgi:WD40 repeat protein
MPAANQTTGDRLKVFLSYASENRKTAIQIQKVLVFNGFDVSIDTEMRARHWQPEIAELILKSHAFIYLLSPHSARSEFCRWEYKQAEKHKKPVIPLWCVPVDKRELPPGLDRWSNIFLYEDENRLDTAWGDGTVRVIEALSDDPEWRKEHTYLEERAVRWNAHDRTDDRLLHGSELVAGLKCRDANEAGLTDLQRAFLARSDEAQEKSLAERLKAVEAREKADKARRTSRRIIAAAGLALILGAAAFAVREWFNFQEAEKLTELAQTTESHLDVALARLAGDDAVTAALFAIEGLRDEKSGDKVQRSRPLVQLALDELAWALARQRERMVLNTGPSRAVLSAVFFPSGVRILSMSIRRAVFSSTALSSAALSSAVLSSAVLSSAYLSSAFLGEDNAAKANKMAVVNTGETAQLWDGDGNAIITLLRHTGVILSAVFSPDGRRILTASADRTAKLWDSDGTWRATLDGHPGTVNSAVFSPDGRRILTASLDTGRLWNGDGKPLLDRDGKPVVLDGSARSPTNPSCGHTGPATYLPCGHTGLITSAVFSPDGRFILTASQDHTAKLWDSDGKLLDTLQGHTGWVWSAVFDHKGGRILTASHDGTARLWLWDGNHGKPLLDRDGKPVVLDGHTAPVVSAEFSSDDLRILTASWDQTARIWDDSGKPVDTLWGHTGRVWKATFSRDGRRILTASEDRTARLWEGTLATPRGTENKVTLLQGHGDVVTSAVFSDDGNYVLTASNDGTARVWDAEADTERASDAEADAERVWNIEAYEEKRKSTAIDRQKLRFPNPQDLIEYAKNALPRCLTSRQRALYPSSPLREPPGWCRAMRKRPYDAEPPAKQSRQGSRAGQ